MKSNIPMPAIVAAVVVVLLLVIFFGYRTLNPDDSKTGIGADGKKIEATATQNKPGAPGSAGTNQMTPINN